MGHSTTRIGMRALLLLACMSIHSAQANIFSGIKNLLFGNNFHTIEKGKAYRSATMGAKSLARRIRRHNIKVVIVLRKIDPKQKWWRRQAGVLKRLGIQFYNVSLSAQQLPSAENVRKIVSIMDNASRANKAILLHCISGCDRTGLISALYQITQLGFSPAEAGRQLSDSYGHFSSRFPAMQLLVRSIPAENSRHWLLHEYDPVAVAGTRTNLIPA